MKIQYFTNVSNLEQLSKIIFLNFIELQNQKGIVYSHDDIRTLLASPLLIGWFLLDDSGKIIGYIVGKKMNLNDGRYVYFIEYFFIIPSYRNKGYGKKMMLICIKKIMELNISYVMLITKKISIADILYRKLGFVDDTIIKITNDDYEVLTYYTNKI